MDHTNNKITATVSWVSVLPKPAAERRSAPHVSLSTTYSEGAGVLRQASATIIDAGNVLAGGSTKQALSSDRKATEITANSTPGYKTPRNPAPDGTKDKKERTNESNHSI
ncbi:Hypothetical protein CINCED_3A013359 [Cinara cedri]|uniref:Uncharacterized protein n=1 Tax=Cinara cedri TaxID=506608 RepID=A0A5E4MTC4_9HEMI|nr:Hypothetical protein CINCED_3A013359 [Cinara cedri]